MGNLFFDEPGVKHGHRGPFNIGDVVRYIGNVPDFYGLTFKVSWIDSGDSRYSCLMGKVTAGNTCPASITYPEGREVTIYKADCELVENANG